MRERAPTTRWLVTLGAFAVLPCTGATESPDPPPQPAKATAADGLPPGTRVLVRHVRVVGNTVLKPHDTAALVAPYEQRSLGPSEIEALRQALTQRLIAAGYVNSGALVPPQSLVDGVLCIQVIEGRLSTIRLAGPRHYRDAHLRSLIWPDLDAPLNVNALQARMQYLLQDGALEQINARLEPGEAPGQSVLDATVREGSRFKLSLSAADDRPPSVGETGGTLGLEARDLLGIGDASAVSFGRTRGYLDYNLNESVRLWASPVSAFFRADRNHGSIVESSLKDLNIVSKETSFEGGLSFALARDLRSALRAELSVYYNGTRTYLLGIPFSFSGDDDGHSVVSAARGALDWTYRGIRQVSAVHTLVNVGLGSTGLFGATVHPDAAQPDSDFVVWNGQAQFLQQFATDTEVLVRASLQLASRALLPSEKVAVGGIDTVRGYAVNTLVRDQGGYASAEVRQTVYRLRIPGLSRGAGDGALAPAAFYDVGAGEDKGAHSTWIAGVGGGLRWTPSPSLSVVFYKGFELHRLPDRGSSLQEQGIHFRVNYDLAF